jgi:hypothetical protein
MGYVPRPISTWPGALHTRLKYNNSNIGQLGGDYRVIIPKRKAI